MQFIRLSRSSFCLRPVTMAGKQQAKLSAVAQPDFHQEDLFVHTYPGSRVLELSNPDAGNYISKSLVTMLDAKIASLKNNGIVAALIFTSRSPDMFSRGLDRSELHDTTSLSSINKLALNVTSLKKPCIAVYSGTVNGTAYGVFAGSEYRLGTTSTSFSIPELGFGRLPLGGTAFHLARGSNEGVAVARYLAISRRAIRAHEMFSLGLLTHIVEEDPHISLADALAHTIPSLRSDEEEIDIVRGLNFPVVEVDAIQDLLDTMHIESDIDLASDETWDKFLLVPPSRNPIENDSFVSSEDPEDLTDESLLKRVQQCFATDDVNKSFEKLLELQTPWGADTAAQLKSLNKSSVENWFKLTRLAAKESLESVYRYEVTASTTVKTK